MASPNPSKNNKDLSLSPLSNTSFKVPTPTKELENYDNNQLIDMVNQNKDVMVRLKSFVRVRNGAL